MKSGPATLYRLSVSGRFQIPTLHICKDLFCNHLYTHYTTSHSPYVCISVDKSPFSFFSTHDLLSLGVVEGGGGIHHHLGGGGRGWGEGGQWEGGHSRVVLFATLESQMFLVCWRLLDWKLTLKEHGGRHGRDEVIRGCPHTRASNCLFSRNRRRNSSLARSAANLLVKLHLQLQEIVDQVTKKRVDTKLLRGQECYLLNAIIPIMSEYSMEPSSTMMLLSANTNSTTMSDNLFTIGCMLALLHDTIVTDWQLRLLCLIFNVVIGIWSCFGQEEDPPSIMRGPAILKWIWNFDVIN